MKTDPATACFNPPKFNYICVVEAAETVTLSCCWQGAELTELSTWWYRKALSLRATSESDRSLKCTNEHTIKFQGILFKKMNLTCSLVDDIVINANNRGVTVISPSFTI